MHRAQSACAVARRQQRLTARSFVANTADGTITETLCAHGFEHRGQQPPIHGCDLGDVERLARLPPSFIHALTQAGAARTVTQRARQVATPACRHGYSSQTQAAESEVRVSRIRGEGWFGDQEAQTLLSAGWEGFVFCVFFLKMSSDGRYYRHNILVFPSCFII